MPIRHSPETLEKMRNTWAAKRLLKASKPQDSRECLSCLQVKPANEFGRYSARLGRPCAGRLRYRCLACEAVETAIGKLRRREADPMKTWVSVRLSDAKIRAKKGNLLFSLTKEILHRLWSDTCAYCNKRMVLHEASGKLQNVATLDQLIPGEGYTENNVVVCCARCNTIKSDASIDEVLNLAKGLLKVRDQRYPLTVQDSSPQTIPVTAGPVPPNRTPDPQINVPQSGPDEN